MNICFIYMNNTKNVGRGAGYVVAAIPSRHNVKFYDLAYSSLDEVYWATCEGHFDILMISVSTLFFHDAVDLIRRVRQRVGIPILFGGIHVMIMKGELLRKYEEIDYLCIGEGENAVMADRADTSNKGRSRKGIRTGRSRACDPMD